MTIKAGDLVQIIRAAPCCGRTDTLWKIFVVDEVNSSESGRCTACGHMFHGEAVAFHPHGACVQIWRLRKFPPLSDLEGQKDSSGLDERQKVGNQLLTGTEFYEALRKMAEGLRS